MSNVKMNTEILKKLKDYRSVLTFSSRGTKVRKISGLVICNQFGNESICPVYGNTIRFNPLILDGVEIHQPIHTLEDPLVAMDGTLAEAIVAHNLQSSVQIVKHFPLI